MWETDREGEPAGPVERRLVAAILFVLALLMVWKGITGLGEPEKPVNKSGISPAPGYVVTTPPAHPDLANQASLYRLEFKEGYTQPR